MTPLHWLAATLLSLMAALVIYGILYFEHADRRMREERRKERVA